jgi:hypothetical protein
VLILGLKHGPLDRLSTRRLDGRRKRRNDRDRLTRRSGRSSSASRASFDGGGGRTIPHEQTRRFEHTKAFDLALFRIRSFGRLDVAVIVVGVSRLLPLESGIRRDNGKSCGGRRRFVDGGRERIERRLAWICQARGSPMRKGTFIARDQGEKQRREEEGDVAGGCARETFTD